MTWGDLRKPSRTARKKAKLKTTKDRRTTETTNKRSAKARDKWRCRFPLCGCKKLGLAMDARLESSHDKHKGAGGNPSGDRSLTELLITLCLHRHQDGIVSRHKGTLRTVYLTAAKNDGPVAWEVAADALPRITRTCVAALGMPRTRSEWIEVAREVAVQQLADVLPWQRRILDSLAEMDL